MPVFFIPRTIDSNKMVGGGGGGGCGGGGGTTTPNCGVDRMIAGGLTLLHDDRCMTYTAKSADGSHCGVDRMSLNTLAMAYKGDCISYDAPDFGTLCDTITLPLGLDSTIDHALVPYISLQSPEPNSQALEIAECTHRIVHFDQEYGDTVGANNLYSGFTRYREVRNTSLIGDGSSAIVVEYAMMDASPSNPSVITGLSNRSTHTLNAGESVMLGPTTDNWSDLQEHGWKQGLVRIRLVDSSQPAMVLVTYGGVAM